MAEWSHGQHARGVELLDIELGRRRDGLGAIWVEPEALAEIEYRSKSAEDKVRHHFCRGVREDLRTSSAACLSSGARSAPWPQRPAG